MANSRHAAGSTAVDPAEFRAAMRSPAMSVAVVTSGAPGARVGVTVTAVSSLSDQPPMMLVCINRLSSALPVIREAGAFCINFLCRDQHDVASLFAGRTADRGEARFRSHDWLRLATGAPVLAQGLAGFDCALTDIHEAATHSILFGEVRALHRGAPAEPLLYAQGQFRHLAASHSVGPA